MAASASRDKPAAPAPGLALIRSNLRRRLGRAPAPLLASGLYQRTLWGRTPDALAYAPPDVWPGDPGHGRDLLGGPAELDTAIGGDDSGLGAEQVHVFGFLRDVHAAGYPRAPAWMRAVIDEWIEEYGRWDRVAWRPELLAERLCCWLTRHPQLLSGADTGFATRFLGSVVRQSRHLLRSARFAPPGAGRFTVAKGLVYAGLCLPAGGKRLRAGLNLLGRAIEEQVLPDGGHCERSPRRHLTVLRDLVEMREVLRGARAEIPQPLQTAIDRMTPMLRFYRHGDGELALFNGTNAVDRALVDVVLAQADAPGRAPSNAPHTGFQRLNAGRTLVIMDTGAPPTPGLDGWSHAGVLSFEMSEGVQRVIVNCGAYAGSNRDWHRGQRATAAHSALVVQETNAARVLPAGGLGRRRPRNVTCRREESEGAVLIDASHDGYQRPFDLVHRRRLYLSAAGNDLRGEDSLSGTAAARGYAVRFHLHPDVEVDRASADERAKGRLTLRLPDGGSWRFQTAGGRLAVEDSIYMGRAGRIRRTRQLVVTGTTGRGVDPMAGETGVVAIVKWAFRRSADS